MNSTRSTTYSAAYLLEVAATLPDRERPYTSQEVRELLEQIADDLVPPTVDDHREWLWQPLPAPALATGLARHFAGAEQVGSDYGRCVLVAQLLGSSANRIDARGSYARADLLRQMSTAVSTAGNAL